MVPQKYLKMLKAKIPIFILNEERFKSKSKIFVATKNEKFMKTVAE